MTLPLDILYNFNVAKPKGMKKQFKGNNLITLHKFNYFSLFFVNMPKETDYYMRKAY